MSTPSSKSPSESEQPRTTKTDSTLPPLGGVVRPYRAIDPFLPDDLSPALPLRVRGPNGVALSMFGVLDSGATRSLFPLQIMSRLGIAKRECRKVWNDTAGGPVPQHLWKGLIEVEVLDLANRRIPVTAAFGEKLPFMVLLGRRDFFEQFRITFDERAQAFALEAHGP